MWTPPEISAPMKQSLFSVISARHARRVVRGTPRLEEPLGCRKTGPAANSPAANHRQSKTRNLPLDRQNFSVNRNLATHVARARLARVCGARQRSTPCARPRRSPTAVAHGPRRARRHEAARGGRLNRPRGPVEEPCGGAPMGPGLAVTRPN